MSAEASSKQLELEGRVEALENELRLLRENPLLNVTSRDRELTKSDRNWREHLLQGVRGLAPYMAVDIGGTLFFFDTSDAKSGRTLFVEQAVRRDQNHLRRALAALDRSGIPASRDLFIDVGAHIGTTTLYAVRHLGFAGAVAIEPSVENMRLLRLGVLANGLEDVVRSIHIAVSGEEGVSGLDVSGVGSEYHRLVGGNEIGGLRQLVPTTTLDALAAAGTLDPTRAGLLWMDIEGYEVYALEGASSLLEHGVPVVAELCRDKLERTGTLERAQEAVAAYYTHVVDLRKPPAEASLLPVTELRRLIDEYAGHCVDVLICRLPGGSAA